MVRYLRVLSIIFIILFVVSGCASWKKNTVTGYDITGTTLKEIGTTSKRLCEANQLKPADCTKLKDIYTKARAAYLKAGDALILAINTEDAVKKKDAMALYKIAISDLSKLIPELLKLADSLGVKISPVVVEGGTI